jgi:hypothetical protein
MPKDGERTSKEEKDGKKKVKGMRRKVKVKGRGRGGARKAKESGRGAWKLDLGGTTHHASC